MKMMARKVDNGDASDEETSNENDGESLTEDDFDLNDSDGEAAD